MNRFDEATKLIGRRSVLKGIGATLAGAVGLIAAHKTSEAFICRQEGVLCATDAQCCSGACDVLTHRCLTSAPVEATAICRQSGVLCGKAAQCCSGSCVGFRCE